MKSGGAIDKLGQDNLDRMYEEGFNEEEEEEEEQDEAKNEMMTSLFTEKSLGNLVEELGSDLTLMLVMYVFGLCFFPLIKGIMMIVVVVIGVVIVVVMVVVIVVVIVVMILEPPGSVTLIKSKKGSLFNHEMQS